jgi:hypothetical protein
MQLRKPGRSVLGSRPGLYVLVLMLLVGISSVRLLVGFLVRFAGVPWHHTERGTEPTWCQLGPEEGTPSLTCSVLAQPGTRRNRRQMGQRQHDHCQISCGLACITLSITQPRL